MEGTQSSRCPMNGGRHGFNASSSISPLLHSSTLLSILHSSSISPLFLHYYTLRPLLHRLSSLPSSFNPSLSLHPLSLHLSSFLQPLHSSLIFLHLSTLPTSVSFSSIYPEFLHLPLLLHFYPFYSPSIITLFTHSSSMSPLLLRPSFFPLPPLSSPHLSTRPPPGWFLHFTHPSLNPPFIPLHHPSSPSFSLCFPSVSLTLAAPSDPAITGAPGYHTAAAQRG